MKRLTCIVIALFAAVLAIAGTWSVITPINPAAAPNPSAQRT